MITGVALKERIDAHIQSLALSRRLPARLYEPMEYILSLKAKRIRPILLMLAYESVSKRSSVEALNLAAAVELFHNFTLMHDDIMDKAPMRRGKPTVHTVWDTDVAILSGDALFALSMGLIVKDFPIHAAALGKEFAEVALGVCEGQMEDMDMAQMQNVPISTYLEMIRKKTAVLLGGCLALGAIAGGGDSRLVEKFRLYGENLGIAFQLQDDLMDAFPPEGFGKQVGGDILEKKKTFLLLRAYELADAAMKERLSHLIEKEENPDQKIRGVLDIFHSLDIENETRSLIEHYFNEARSLSEEPAYQTQFHAIRIFSEEISNRKL